MGNNKSTLEEAKRGSSNIKNQDGSSVNRVLYSSTKIQHEKKIPNSANNVNTPHGQVWNTSSSVSTQYHPYSSSFSGSSILPSSPSLEANENQLFSNNNSSNSTRTENISPNVKVPPERYEIQKNTKQTFNGNRVFPSSTTLLETKETQFFSNSNNNNSNSAGVENMPHNIKDPPESLGLKKNTIQTMDTLILLELSGKDSSYIVKHLKENKTIFENSIQGPISDSLLVIMMKIVRKICLADTYDKIEILKVVSCDDFLDVLGNYIINLPTHQRDCVKEDLLFLEESVLPFFEAILLLMPKLVCNKLRDLLIKTTLTVTGLEQYQNVKFDDTIKMKLKDMETSVKCHLNLNQSEVQQIQDLPQRENDQQKNIRSCPGSSQGSTQIKHLNFLTHNVFPNMIKKLDVPAHKIRGIRKNIYFVECEEKSEGFISEGEFLIALAQYLLKYYYKAKNFLFLTTNELRMKSIDELKNKDTKLKDMKVGVIDTCEEFEATVILISFAASESEGIKQNIYEERQLCKALLGAKNGIYMIGNLSILEKQGPFWKKMKSLLQQHEAVSSALPLLCEVHQIVIPVASVENFKMVMRSGCSRRCEYKLSCGHLCKRLCHLDDREHKNYKCREPCLRKRAQCSRNHKCLKLCHETCELCTVSVIHNNMELLCRELYTKLTINSVHSDVFPEKKKNMLPCNHYSCKEVSIHQMDMWSMELMNLCQEPCTATLQCGHVCTGTCGSCRQGRVHMPCRDRSKITLACGHRALTVCSSVMGECNQKCFYECPHAKCKEKCGIPCTPCKEICAIGCVHSRCTKKCYEICDNRPCFESCKKLLSCGHPCIGICGEPCPPGPEHCRVCNADRMKKKDSTGVARFVLLGNCNHVVRSNDLDRRAFSKQHKIESLACPICGFNITKTLRYINYAKMLQRNLVTIRQVHSKYKENITGAFWNVAKEIRSLSLPKEIENHPKIDEIKMRFQVVKENHAADHKTMILLMFLRNLLYPVVHGITGMVSPNHLDWFLYLLLERYEMGLCSQVVRELYKEIVEYQKMKGKVYKQHILELHRAIAFFTLMEKNTWVKCSKGHLSSFNSLLTECGTCDDENHGGYK